MTKTNGGVVMVCFLPGYVTETDRKDSERAKAERDRLVELYDENVEKVNAGMAEWRKTHPGSDAATLSDVADHIDHIRKVIGVDHIGVGGDFDGFTGGVKGLEDVSKYPDLFAELLRRGYSQGDIKKIAGLNVLRALRGAERVAKELQAAFPTK
jgi:membrane dipeptidase